ncbi:hypothetical protein DFH27DRAFT_143249 [Peziza echinospora]|nr:hypothetical protein DFH27DRAFT_143249 [Peziza echinospora]
MSSGRHSYSGPSDGQYVLNPIAPTTSTRSMGAAGGTSKSSASRARANGGNGRHSLPSSSTSQQIQQQQQQHQQQAAPPNHHRPPTQYSHDSDMVVENIPNSTTTGSNNKSAAPQHYHQQHINTFINHQPLPAATPQPPPQNTRKSKHAHQAAEIIQIDSEPDDNRNGHNSSPANNMAPHPMGPSLAGSASRNRSLLAHHYDPVRPNRASASPSISSLIDPPQPSQPPPTSSYRKPTEKPSGPPVVKPDIDSPPAAATIHVASAVPIAAVAPAAPVAQAPPTEKAPSSKEATGSRSPKTTKAKKMAAAAAAAAAVPPPSSNASSVPTPPGNGILGIDILGNESSEKVEIPTIYIHVPLNGETNKYVNFAKLTEEKYGIIAVNPRVNRDRLRLGGEASDIDMIESESESNMEDKQMSGMDGDSTTEAKNKRKPKRKLQDNYDQHDPFIDDSELFFEEQAAATKDGFFVYSGPLIPQGEKVQVERADGTVKRGRGGGRARGSGRGGGAPKASAPRKPRMTKKEKLEREERERQAQQAKSF